LASTPSLCRAHLFVAHSMCTCRCCSRRPWGNTCPDNMLLRRCVSVGQLLSYSLSSRQPLSCDLLEGPSSYPRFPQRQHRSMLDSCKMLRSSSHSLGTYNCSVRPLLDTEAQACNDPRAATVECRRSLCNSTRSSNHFPHKCRCCNHQHRAAQDNSGQRGGGEPQGKASCCSSPRTCCHSLGKCRCSSHHLPEMRSQVCTSHHALEADRQAWCTSTHSSARCSRRCMCCSRPRLRRQDQDSNAPDQALWRRQLAGWQTSPSVLAAPMRNKPFRPFLALRRQPLHSASRYRNGGRG